MKTLFYFLSLATAVSLGQSALAQESRHKALTDDLFVKKAAEGGLAEVDLGKVAQQSGSSQNVKDFGAKMVTDHSKINDDLKAVASKDSLTLPDKPGPELQAKIDKLSKETGATFDTDYLHMMLAAHRKDKALFKEEIDTAKNPDLKKFAQDALPVIQQHLDMVEGMTAGGTGHHHHKAEAGGNAGAATSPTEAGSSGESKSGLAPGANGNPTGNAMPTATP